MFIKPIKCQKCSRTGRVGEEHFSWYEDGSRHEVWCVCGNRFSIPDERDQLILSKGKIIRIETVTNRHESGTITLAPGSSHKIKFQCPFDTVCAVYFAPPNFPLAIQEYWVENDGMTLLTSTVPGYPVDEKQVEIRWRVEGLVDTDKMPSWYLYLCSAVTHALKRLYRQALLDYGSCFEAFLKEFLEVGLAKLYGDEKSSNLLRRAWRIEDRCKDLLKTITGKRLTDKPDIYRAWYQYVRKPIDKIRHGGRVLVNSVAADQAHEAVYQAIRWVQSLEHGDARP